MPSETVALLIRALLLVLGAFLVANAAWLAGTANLNLGMALSAVAGLALVGWGIAFDAVHRHPVLQGVAIGVVVVVLALAGFLTVYGASDNVTYREDALIVLGASVHRNQVSNTLAGRLDAAMAYRERNPDALLVLSGGRGPQEDVTEAAAMRDYLLAHGVPEASLVVEEHSTTTQENFRYSKAILDARLAPGYSVAFVTNEFHVYRAERTARDFGLDPTHAHSVTPWYFWATNYLREELAVVAGWVGLD